MKIKEKENDRPMKAVKPFYSFTYTFETPPTLSRESIGHLNQQRISLKTKKKIEALLQDPSN